MALAAEICDGWLALFYAPEHEGFYRDALDEGFARDGARRSRDDFEVVASVPLDRHATTIEAAVDAMRPMYALYFGGMGARDKNFHADVARRMGYEAEVDRSRTSTSTARRTRRRPRSRGALIEQLTLIGPPAKIRHDLEPWRASQVTTLLVQGAGPDMLEDLAALVA